MIAGFPAWRDFAVPFAVPRNAWPAVGLLAAAILLGGTSRHGFLGDTLLQFLALGVGIHALWGWPARAHRFPAIEVALCGAVFAIGLLQLIPLPLALWQLLPGASIRLAAYDVLDQAPGFAPLTLAPNATWLSVVSLIVPCAMFLATVRMSLEERRFLAFAFVGLGVLSALLGLLQIAQGPASPLRPFSFTNPTEAVGLFANRNHFAALIYVSLAFTTAVILHTLAGLPEEPNASPELKRTDPRTIMIAVFGGVMILCLLAAEGMARSRAGLGLTMVALLTCAALPFSGWHGQKKAALRLDAGRQSGRVVLSALVITVLLLLEFGVYRILDRFARDPLLDPRTVFSENTLEAARDFFPWGSGLGTFVQLYPSYEAPIEAIPGSFANHAHNDLLELLLETGALGAILGGIFVVWLVMRSALAWQPVPQEGTPTDQWIARAASIALVLLILHSAVDYPLRTATMMAVFGMFCALLVPPLLPEAAAAEQPRAGTSARRPERRRPVAPAAPERRQAPPTMPPSMHNELPPPQGAVPEPVFEWPSEVAGDQPARVKPAQQGDLWSSDAAWPEEWTQPAQDPAHTLGRRRKKPDPEPS